MKLKQLNFKKVKSTNQTAIRFINSSKNEFGLIVSEAQSKGKGRYGSCLLYTSDAADE